MSAAANQFSFCWNLNEKIKNATGLDCCALDLSHVLKSNSHHGLLITPTDSR